MFQETNHMETNQKLRQINPKSCGKRQNTWRREKKKKPKAGTERRNKSCRRKKRKKKRKEMDFNVKVTDVSVEVGVISFNKRG